MSASIASIAWVHIGDLHVCDDRDWESLGRLKAIVAEIRDFIGDAADFVYLPGDNANHGEPDQYRAIVEALAPLPIPYRVIAGDHDFEPGDLSVYESFFPEQCRPESEVIAGHRCLFLDVVSEGAGGPDFRGTMHHINRLGEELAQAEAEGQTPLVFMHAYPSDLAADGDRIARILAEGRVAFVDTGHTHYNELLNDGRVIYGATRSTGEIEEGCGRPGYSIVCVHDGMPSWRFKELGTAWPFVQIVSPCDQRLITRPADRRQVPRPGHVTVEARVFGQTTGDVTLVVDDRSGVVMQSADGRLYSADVELDAGLHHATVHAGADKDTIRVLVRDSDDIPRRGLPAALGHPVNAIGAWPEHGIEGTQLGPNRNGQHW